MDKRDETFQYDYSAKEQEEIRKIREKYLPKAENKLEQLRCLDKKAARPGMIAAMVVGIVGALLLGVGMCCTMVWSEALFAPGVAIGAAGLALIGAAYPLNRRITAKQREKLAPEIMKLTDELSQK